MRGLIALALGATLTALMGTAAQSQTYDIQVEIDERLLDGEAGVIDYPEDVTRDQILDFTDYTTTLLNQEFGTGPRFSNPDLPSPYNGSLATQSGYYRVTLTTPDFRVVRP